MGGDPITTYIHRDDPPSTGFNWIMPLWCGLKRNNFCFTAPCYLKHVLVGLLLSASKKQKCLEIPTFRVQKNGTYLEWMGHHSLYNLNQQFFLAILLTSQNGSQSFLLCFFYASTPPFIAFLVSNSLFNRKNITRNTLKKIFQTEKKRITRNKKKTVLQWLQSRWHSPLHIGL